jgi:hypothetical protein
MGKASKAKELARAARAPGHPAVTRALERLDAAIAELETEAPGWQAEMDELRASRGQGNVDDWPEWCLLPGDAPYAIATANGLVDSEVINMKPVDQMSALYAWLQGKNIWQGGAAPGLARPTPASTGGLLPSGPRCLACRAPH